MTPPLGSLSPNMQSALINPKWFLFCLDSHTKLIIAPPKPWLIQKHRTIETLSKTQQNKLYAQGYFFQCLALATCTRTACRLVPQPKSEESEIVMVLLLFVNPCSLTFVTHDKIIFKEFHERKDDGSLWSLLILDQFSSWGILRIVLTKMTEVSNSHMVVFYLLYFPLIYISLTSF